MSNCGYLLKNFVCPFEQWEVVEQAPCWDGRTGMAIRTPLLTVLSRGPPMILRGSFLLCLKFKLITKLTKLINGQRWAIASWTFSAGHPFCHVKSHLCRFDEGLHIGCIICFAALRCMCLFGTPELHTKFAKTGMTDIDPAVRRWQIGWRVVMFWHPGEYARALSQV